MKMNVYSIYDTAAGCFMRPFFMQSDGQAHRAFSDLAVSADHEVGKHPEDYTLFRLGVFDDRKGALVAEDPESIVTGVECVAASRSVNREQMSMFHVDELKPGGTN